MGVYFADTGIPHFACWADNVADVPTVNTNIYYLGPWGVPSYGNPWTCGEARPPAKDFAGLGPGQGPKQKNIKYPRHIQHGKDGRRQIKFSRRPTDQPRCPELGNRDGRGWSSVNLPKSS